MAKPRWLVMKFEDWNDWKLTINGKVAKVDPPVKGMIGLLPVFENREEAIEFAIAAIV